MPPTTATRSSCPSTSTWWTRGWPREPAPPSRAGLTRRQLLDAVRRIAMELPLAGMDVVEVSPPFDHAEITAYLAGRVVLEALSGIAWRRRREAGEPVRYPTDPLLANRPAQRRSANAGPATPPHANAGPATPPHQG